MNKPLLTLLLAASSLPTLALAADAAPASPHTFTGNVTLASEYLYRGIAQTNGKAALEGGFDYAHTSGLYPGLWGSTISWVSDGNASVSAPLELDIYAGYKGSLGGDYGYDLGVLTYHYPGTYPAAFTKPDTTELYAAVNWKFISLKYSHSVSDHIFGFTNPSGGKTKDRSDASYSDFKLGLTKEVGFGTLGLSYSTTNAHGDAGQPYRNAFGRDLGDARLVISFGKTF